MLYIDNDNIQETHTLDEISNSRIDGNNAVTLLLNGTVPFRFGADAASVLENLRYVRFYFFKDETGELLVSPDLIEVEIDQEYEDESGAVTYDSIRRIVSFRDFNKSLKEYGYKLQFEKIEDLLQVVEGNTAVANIVKNEKGRRLIKM